MFDERTTSLLENMHVPNTYWKDKSQSYMYWLRALYERVSSAMDFTLPESWSREFFLLILFSYGWVPIIDTKRWGVNFNYGHLIGYNFYYEPTHVQIANPKLTKKFEIGKDCEILRMTSDYHGIWDILAFYAEKLSEASQGIDVALMNSKVPFIFSTNGANPAQAETLKKVYDKMKAGEACIIYDNKQNLFEEELIPQGDEPFQSFINDLKSNYMGTELIDNLNSILQMFYAEIGLPTQSTEHGKSHTLNIEAEQVELQSSARLQTWLNNLNDSIKIINNHFDIGLEVKEHEREITTDRYDKRDEPIGN